MSIPKAYCTEADRVIDIFEAHDLFFARGSSGKRFDFRCPDPECRALHNPEIIGVNYDKKPNQDDFVVRPHFRVKTGSIHGANCPWIELGIAIEELEKEKGDASSLSFLKKSELVEKFTPSLSDSSNIPDPFDIDGVVLDRVRQFSDRRERVNTLKGHLKTSIISTSRLHEVVRCYQSMTPDERETILLTIDPFGRKSYRSWFCFSKWCRPRNLPLIYYGGANVLKYRSGYSLRFWAQSTYEEAKPRVIFLFISNERIDGFRGGRALRIVLDAGIERQEFHKFPLDLFVFGTPSLDEESQRLNIIFDSLHSIVVMLSDRGEK